MLRLQRRAKHVSGHHCVCSFVDYAPEGLQLHLFQLVFGACYGGNSKMRILQNARIAREMLQRGNNALFLQAVHKLCAEFGHHERVVGIRAHTDVGWRAEQRLLHGGGIVEIHAERAHLLPKDLSNTVCVVRVIRCTHGHRARHNVARVENARHHPALLIDHNKRRNAAIGADRVVKALRKAGCRLPAAQIAGEQDHIAHMIFPHQPLKMRILRRIRFKAGDDQLADLLLQRKAGKNGFDAHKKHSLSWRMAAKGSATCRACFLCVFAVYPRSPSCCAGLRTVS